jgi:hypothetical protein
MSLLNPTNFLDLVQRLSFEAGIAGAGPTTVIGATGQSEDLAAWINQAWLEIQSKYLDWDFMRVSPGVSFVTVAGQMIYTPAQAGVAVGVVNSWARETFRVYNTVTGTPSEIRIKFWPYDDWRDTFQISALRTSQVLPVNFTILPNQSLGLQCPAAGYTITGDYFSAPLGFAADADIPSIPVQFIMLIVYEALKQYALFESAPEVLTRAEKGANRLWNLLENGRLPQVYTAGSLA